MRQQTVRVTGFDFYRLHNLIEGPRSMDPHEAVNVDLLERRLYEAEIMPADRIGPDLVTINSEVQVEDLDAHEEIVFRVVLPAAADPASGNVSVLAPLGMAVPGRRIGDNVTCETPGGLHRLRVEGIVYQPERVGVDFESRGRRYA
ncbi:MAG TPA: GreA/GreB family elongation factor [Candidatus Polarisedimenticolia bacterium]|jgi:regulator of nucleoside diphosphate kinase